MIIGKFPRKSPSIWKLCISKQLTDKIGVIKHFLKKKKNKTKTLAEEERASPKYSSIRKEVPNY